MTISSGRAFTSSGAETAGSFRVSDSGVFVSDGSSAGACGPLLGELIAGSTREEDDARKRLQALGFALSKTVRLVLFRPIDERKAISLAYLRAQLEQAFHGSMGIIQGN